MNYENNYLLCSKYTSYVKVCLGRSTFYLLIELFTMAFHYSGKPDFLRMQNSFAGL